MEDLQELLASGKIYDGCIVRAQGVVRFNNGEVYIESMRNLVDIGGENFEKLCAGEGKASLPTSAEEQRTASEITKELMELKQNLQELTEKNTALSEGFSKSMQMVDALKKQLDDDQTFSTNTIYDLTKTISELQANMKVMVFSEDVNKELEVLRKNDAHHRSTIASLQKDIRAFEAHKSKAVDEVLASHKVEKDRLEQQINLLHEELSQKGSMDDTASVTSASSDVHSKRSKLKQLFGSKKYKKQPLPPTLPPALPALGSAAF